VAGVHAYLYGERAIMNRETGGFLPITVLFILAERAQLVKSRDEPSIVAIKTALFASGCAREPHAARHGGQGHDLENVVPSRVNLPVRSRLRERETAASGNELLPKNHVFWVSNPDFFASGSRA